VRRIAARPFARRVASIAALACVLLSGAASAGTLRTASDIGGAPLVPLGVTTAGGEPDTPSANTVIDHQVACRKQ